MAKLRGAKKAAFLRRMARGRAKASRGSVRPVRRRRRRNGLNSYNPSPVRRRRRRVARLSFTPRRRRRNPTAVIANPGFFNFGALRRRKRKGSTMAKRRRKRRASARRASPRRRVHRRRPASRRRHVRRRRRTPQVVYMNGRRRRRRNPSRRRYHRRRNPGMGGLLKRAFVPYAVGFVTAGAMAVVDTGLAAYPMAKNVGKVLLAVGVAATVGRKHPTAATAAISAIAASQGYSFGTSIAGGMIAQSPQQAVKGLGEMSATYPELGALLNGGVGALLSGPPDVDDAVVNYATALNNMADDD